MLHRVHNGRQRIIGDGQQPLANAQRRRQASCHLGQRQARRQPVRAQQVRGHIAVAQTKPGFLAVAGQHVEHLPAVPGQPPARLRVGDPGQRVHHRVQIGGDVQAIEREVIGHIADDRQMIGRQNLRQPEDQPGPTYPAGQRNHARRVCQNHRTFVSRGARSLLRASAG